MKLNRKIFNNKGKIFSIVAICLATVLVITSFLGLGFSIYGIYENYKLSPDYTRSLNVKTKLKPEITGFNDTQLSEEQVKKTAESFSNFLKDTGSIDYDVWYEYYQSKKVDQFDDGYLNVNIPVEKRTFIEYDEEKEADVAPQIQYFDALNSNNRTVLYRWYAKPTTSEIESIPYTEPVYTAIPLELMFNWKKTKVELSTETNTYGLALSLNDATTNLFTSPIILAEQIHRDMAAYQKLEDKKLKQAPELFIINDLNNLINKANFYISVSRIASQSQTVESDQYYDDIWKPFIKGTTINDFYDDFQNDHGKNDYAYLTSKASIMENPQMGSVYEKYNEIFNYLDPTNEDGTSTGTVKYEWMQKNVEQIITSSNVSSFIPQKINDKILNPKELDINHKVDWMFWQTGTEASGKELYKTIDEYAFNAEISLLPIDSLGQPDGKIDTDIVLNFYKNNLQYSYVEPSFYDAIFGNNNIAMWSLIALVVFLFIIGIGMIYWYRFTGFFSWLMIITACAVSFVVLLVTSHLISTALIVGLFLVALTGIISAIIICEKIKRKIVEGNDTNIVINQGFLKSFLSSFDLSIILLLIGISLVYFSTAAIVPMGIMLISGAIFNWLFIFLGNWLINFCFFINRILFNKKKLIASYNPDISVVDVYNTNLNNLAYSEIKAREEVEKIEKQKVNIDAPKIKNFSTWIKFSWEKTKVFFKKLVPVTLECPQVISTAGRFTNSFYASKPKKLNIFNSKFEIISLVVSILFIVAFFCFIFLGINNVIISTDSFRVVVDKTGYDAISSMSFGASYSLQSYDGWYYLYFNDALAPSIQASILLLAPSAQLQTVFGHTQVDILMSCIKTISISGAFILIYLTIRNNWTVFFPLLISIVITPIIALGFISILGIWFDQTIIYGLIIVFTINVLLSSMMCNNINGKWKRKEIYTQLEMRYLINSELKNSSKVWILFACVLALFFILFIISMPLALLGSSIVILVGSIFALIVPFYILPRTLYYFLCFRIKYVNSTIINNDKRLAKNSFDKVDEQLIDGINKNTPIRIFI